MPRLQFPTDRIGGMVAWDGSWSDECGPVLATGTVSVADGAAVQLEVEPLRGTKPSGDGSWNLIREPGSLRLDFLRDLPPEGIESVSIRSADEASVAALAHLAPGLRRLYLGWTGFGDPVLPTVAALTGLTYLRTFGNHVTDDGVQQLAALVDLEDLYLEEETLTAAAFAFVAHLPRLGRLGLQDVALSPGDVERLRACLPGVRLS